MTAAVSGCFIVPYIAMTLKSSHYERSKKSGVVIIMIATLLSEVRNYKQDTNKY